MEVFWFKMGDKTLIEINPQKDGFLLFLPSSSRWGFPGNKKVAVILYHVGMKNAFFYYYQKYYNNYHSQNREYRTKIID